LNGAAIASAISSPITSARSFRRALIPHLPHSHTTPAGPVCLSSASRSHLFTAQLAGGALGVLVCFLLRFFLATDQLQDARVEEEGIRLGDLTR